MMPKLKLIKPMSMNPKVRVSPSPEINVQYKEGTDNVCTQTDITGPIVAAIGKFGNANVLNLTGETPRHSKLSDFPIHQVSYTSP